MKKIQYSLSEIETVAQNLLKDAANCSVITLSGSLGAGKTTLTKALLAQLGVAQDSVISPTFTYMNVYRAADGKIVYHFDLYRLKSLQEFEQAGFFEYLYQPNSLVLIEWPEIIASILVSSVCAVELHTIDQQKRQINYSYACDNN